MRSFQLPSSTPRFMHQRDSFKKKVNLVKVEQDTYVDDVITIAGGRMSSNDKLKQPSLSEY